MEAKHTPGPWIMNGNYPEDQAVIYDEATGTNIAVVYTGDDGNARLIAAAPGLLEALDRAVQDIDSGWADDAEDRFPWLIDARAAIAKARGGA